MDSEDESASKLGEFQNPVGALGRDALFPCGNPFPILPAEAIPVVILTSQETDPPVGINPHGPLRDS